MARRLRKAIDIPEKDVLKFVLSFFNGSRNVMLFRRNVGKVTTFDPRTGKNRFLAFSKAGQSDVYGVVKEVHCERCGVLCGYGQHVEIECKRYRGKLSDSQKEYLQQMRLFGGKTVVAMPIPSEDDPTGFKHLRKQLEGIETAVCLNCAGLADSKIERK